MKRSDFFKKLGVLMVAPKLVTQIDTNKNDIVSNDKSVPKPPKEPRKSISVAIYGIN